MIAVGLGSKNLLSSPRKRIKGWRRLESKSEQLKSKTIYWLPQKEAQFISWNDYRRALKLMWGHRTAEPSQDRLRWRNYFTNCSTCERSFAFFLFSGKRKIHFPEFSYQKISSLSANAIQFLLPSVCESFWVVYMHKTELRYRFDYFKSFEAILNFNCSISLKLEKLFDFNLKIELFCWF